MRIGTVIHEIASGYLGQNEVGQNESFESKLFEKHMKNVGWSPGQAWCSYFVELCWKQAYKNSVDHLIDLDKLFSGSAVQTFKNFNNAGWGICGVPMMGSLAVWQKYKDGEKTWKGHIAIIEGFKDDTITTIDGNSNNDGSRNGYTVARVKRKVITEADNGLVLLGFIYPNEI